MTTIQVLGGAGGPNASHISIRAVSNSEILISLRNGSGNLQLIGWNTPGEPFFTGGNAEAGEAQEVALALFGRRAVTAVRSGGGRLLLISWDIGFEVNGFTRLADSGDQAGDASDIWIRGLDDKPACHGSAELSRQSVVD